MYLQSGFQTGTTGELASVVCSASERINKDDKPITTKIDWATSSNDLTNKIIKGK